MKIQINGFDIEVNTDEANLSIKVLDATGKELSNNTFAQSLDTAAQTTPVDMPSAEDTANAAPVQGAEGEIAPTTPTEGQPVETPETELAEGLVPTFEQFKRLRAAGKLK